MEVNPYRSPEAAEEQGETQPILAKAPRSRLFIPACGLFGTGVIEWLLVVGNLIETVLTAARGEPVVDNAEIIGGLVSLVIHLVVGGILINGAGAMFRVRNLDAAYRSAAISIVPCHACCLLAAPFGVWALVVLRDPAVQSAFAENANELK